MSYLDRCLAHFAQRWLERFCRRQALGPAVNPSPPDESGALSAAGSERMLLHVACGHATINTLPVSGFRDLGWQEVRLDADPSVQPDVVGSMVDMSAVPDGFADAIYSSHGIEHLYWHDVPRALAEFYRVLKDDGFAVITCPDLQAAAQMIAEDRLFETAYPSPAGPITPFDILYSYRPFVAANPEWMSHHCGFTLTTLNAVLREAGFPLVYGFRRAGGFDLWVLASKSPRSEAEMAAMAEHYLVSGS
jgi:predicted SAM-dependent methyltransferase